MLRTLNLKWGMDLGRSNGDGSWTLPMPGRFILDSQGTKVQALAIYCDPLVTLDLEYSGFPKGWKT